MQRGVGRKTGTAGRKRSHHRVHQRGVRRSRVHSFNPHDTRDAKIAHTCARGNAPHSTSYSQRAERTDCQALISNLADLNLPVPAPHSSRSHECPCICHPEQLVSVSDMHPTTCRAWRKGSFRLAVLGGADSALVTSAQVQGTRRGSGGTWIPGEMRMVLPECGAADTAESGSQTVCFGQTRVRAQAETAARAVWCSPAT